MKQLTIIFAASLLFTSCSIEKQMLNNRLEACKIAEDICNNTDSIVQTKEVYRHEYNTTSRLRPADEWYKKKQDVKLPQSLDSLNQLLGFNVCDSCYTDTLKTETKTATASSYIKDGEHFLDIINKDFYEAKLTIYKDSIVSVTEKYRKTKASYQYYKDKFEQEKAWKTVWMWISIILIIGGLVLLVLTKLRLF